MTEQETKKLININLRLSLTLGYAMGFILRYGKMFDGKEKEQYQWLVTAIENVLYLDKPLPPMP